MAIETQKNTKTRNLIIVGALLLIVAFLLGFIPQFQNASGLRSEIGSRDQRIAQLEREAALSRARDLASLLHVELTRKNYGVAEQHATAFFNHVRGLMNDAAYSPMKGTLEELLSQRDTMISSIAKPDPVSETLARDMLLRTHQLALQ